MTLAHLPDFWIGSIEKFKNMSHRYDVTYLYLYEATQKTQNQHHLKLEITIVEISNTAIIYQTESWYKT